MAGLEQAGIMDQGIDVVISTKFFDSDYIAEDHRELVLKQCSKRWFRCLRHEVAGCNIAMQPGGWIPVEEALRALRK